MLRRGTASVRIIRLATVGLATVGVLVIALAGCAQPITPDPGADSLVGGPRDSFGEPGSYPAVGEDCESANKHVASPPPLTPLPADAVLASARRCLFQAEVVPGDGEWLMRIEQRATSGLEALAAALRLPSERQADGQACLAIGYVPIVITVTDTLGRSVQPQVPQTACGAPMKEAVDAIAALPWTTVATTKARQIRSELEVSSGCSGSWKPMIPLIAAEGSGTQTATVDTTPRPLRVCRFGLDPDPVNVITLNDGKPYRIGVLISASTLDVAAAEQLLTAVSAAPRALGGCSQPEQPFAVVSSADSGSPWVAIELGGCYRASVDGENYLRQLDAATVAALVG